MLYHRKLLISDKFIELYEYGKVLKREFIRKERKKPKEYQQLDLLSSYDKKHEGKQLSKRKDSIARTRSKIRRTINANPDLTKFVTMTFNREMVKPQEANKIFKAFILRMNYRYPNFKYLSVVEFQKDVDFFGHEKPNGGNVHYHFLCNLPFIDIRLLNKIWDNGFCWINRIDDVDNVGAYVCKYLNKDMQETRLFNKKKFFCSENLNRTIEIFDDKTIDNFIEITGLSIAQPVYKSEFDNEWVGSVKYNQFKLK